MKSCQCCGLSAPAEALTCPACGEASWLDLPSPVKPEVAPAPKPGKGKAQDLPGVR